MFLLIFLGSGAIYGHSIYEPYLFTAFAGTPPGSTNGIGSAARFDGPFGTAVDSIGNIYVADSHNNTIRRVTPGGFASTVAGKSGQEGTDDGVGEDARFFNPSGVTVDGSGNLYVADSGNHTIRKITPEGIVSTIAGEPGMPGSSDGTGNVARFNFPTGIAVGDSGNLYVADTVNDTIRKITPASEVTTLAGLAGAEGSTDGTGSEARFTTPLGVTVNASGVVYVGDSGNHTIRKITPDGVVSTLAGLAGSRGSLNGFGDAARFDVPCGVAVDSDGNTYVADTFNHTIRKVSAVGLVTTLAGLADEGPGGGGSMDGLGSAARFFKPRGVAVNSSGTIYVGDTQNNTIRKITSEGLVTTLVGLAGLGSQDGTGSGARFAHPNGLVFDRADNLYVADNYNHTIRKITPAGMVTTFAGMAGVSGSADGTGTAARFNFPRAIAIDAEGNLYVSDRLNHTIRKITPEAEVSTLAGSPGVPGSADGLGSAARFDEPYGLAVDNAGNVYVVDTDNYTIRKITPAGLVSTIAGTAGISGYADGVGPAAKFNLPSGMAIDFSQNLYITDSVNYVIRKMTLDGVVSTFAGIPGSSGGDDGMTAESRFFRPAAITVDLSGNIYVSDTNNDLIRKIDPAGNITTLGGLVGRRGGAVGAGSNARFFEPLGIAVNSHGQLCVADNVNNAIRFGLAVSPVITSPLAATATVGAEFAYQFTTEGEATLAIPNPPSGLTFDSNLGALAGNPTAAGTFLVQLSATNAIGTTTATLVLTIAPAPLTDATIVSGSGVSGGIGKTFSYLVKAGNVTSSATIAADGLPAGLVLDQNSGLISGILSADPPVVDSTTDLVTGAPAREVSSLVKLTLHDGAENKTFTLQLAFTSDGSFPLITSPSQANVTIGQPFYYQIVAPTVGEAEPTSYSLDGPLPAGLQFDSVTGVISGIYQPPTTQKSSDSVGKDISGGVPNVVGSVQLFAHNRRGTGMLPLLFTNIPPGAGNLSTRVLAGSGDDVAISGFIITGNARKRLLLRALGPSLQVNGQPMAGTLQDPILELRDSRGELLASDDNWRDTNEADISATDMPPGDDREPALLAALDPGSYTAVIRGKNNASGLSLLETYDLGTNSIDIARVTQLANISTRGTVASGTDVLIGGFIILGNTPSNVLVRALGPELSSRGIAQPLPDPVLEVRDSEGNLLSSNDDWETNQEAQILFTNVAPSDPRESAIYATLTAGNYTAVVGSKDGVAGIALVEVYVLP